MFHPWRTLRALAHVTLNWHDGGPAGWTHFESSTISLRRGMTQSERRCTLAHELRHLVRGPVMVMHVADEEQQVEAESACQLIELERLGEALAWSCDAGEIAEELWVDRGTLAARIAALRPDELDYLERRLRDKEHQC